MRRRDSEKEPHASNKEDRFPFSGNASGFCDAVTRKRMSFAVAMDSHMVLLSIVIWIVYGSHTSHTISLQGDELKSVARWIEYVFLENLRPPRSKFWSYLPLLLCALPRIASAKCINTRLSDDLPI